MEGEREVEKGGRGWEDPAPRPPPTVGMGPPSG